jgi:uncharacterized SAM-binding protein YcdF (DUF218 family)
LGSFWKRKNLSAFPIDTINDCTSGRQYPMFFLLSKTAAALLLPSNLLVALVLFGFILMSTRFRRAGGRLFITSLVLLGLLSISPLGHLLSHALEVRFPPWHEGPKGAPDGIVVLGGGINPELSRIHGDTVFSGAAAGRVIALAKLARAYPNVRIVYSGGDPSLTGHGPAEADFLYPFLDSLGEERARVVLESRSRNTAENAAFSKQLMQPKPGERWLLVTSAQHMPRAIGSFRRVGFDVEAYPVDWRATGGVDLLAPLSGLAGNLARVDAAAREWIGLLAYWLTGRTTQFLPGPQL